MIIGIDISQIVYEGTGVGKYVKEMVINIIKKDTVNQYVLFASTLRQQHKVRLFFETIKEFSPRVSLRLFLFPPKLLDFLWNQLHIISIESFIGDVDIFWSSDWTQPPLAHAKGITTIHDLTTYRFPESFYSEIVSVHKRKLARSKLICSAFLCDSEATKKDAETLLGIPANMITVVYPGY